MRKGRGGGTTVTRTERKTDGRIMRGQAGSENNKQEKAERRGDGARFVDEGPGGRAQEERRPKDHCSALPGQQSQQQEALPWQAANSAHMHTNVLPYVRRELEYQVQVLLKIFNCEHDEYTFVVKAASEKKKTSGSGNFSAFVF